ncbi:hypothetical protein EVAR_76464_1 [Eumeta japonica]|uniref:Mos1 transposase HTH domain-containing protein n=1 Tax=Eumeta variegata TaxID=151549 RepID=A0A4C1T4H0_EUMVA|nr:hypothetical protein EVAR_76464_1 [Eumeta japonica]
MIFYEFLFHLRQQERLQSAFHGEALSLATVCNWFNEFKHGGINLAEYLREGRPSMATTENNISTVRLLIDNDMSVLSADSDKLKHWDELSAQNLSRKLAVRKLCTWWISYNSIEAQKFRRVD